MTDWLMHSLCCQAYWHLLDEIRTMPAPEEPSNDMEGVGGQAGTV